MNGRFVPDDWILTDKLRQYARDKGYSESQIDDQLEDFRLCEFPKARKDWNRAWQRWVKRAIKWGHVVPATVREYRKPELVSEEQRKADVLAFERDPLIRKLRN
jgi:hypothetical protein